MSALRRMPVSGSIHFPYIGIGYVVLAAYVVATCITEAVIVFVCVSYHSVFGNYVAASELVPVVSLVGFVYVITYDGMLTVNTADLTYTVVVVIGVRSLSVCGNFVVALGEAIPVMSSIFVEHLGILRMRAELVEANVANAVAVAVAVLVESLENVRNYVLTFCELVPVIIFVA